MKPRVLIAIVWLLAAQCAGAQTAPDETLRSVAPPQRGNAWQAMTPQQRVEFWRRLTPEQRQSLRQQMAPAQRDATRGQTMQQRGLPPAAPPVDNATPPMLPGGPGPRRLSPEERQKLREQIMESTRDLREQRRHMWMERHKGR